MRWTSDIFKFSSIFFARNATAFCDNSKDDEQNFPKKVETREILGRKVVARKPQESDFSTAVQRSEEALEHYILVRGIPGLSVSVSVNGETAWARGFGYANVEQRSPCTEKSVMRIGSINKPIVMAIVAQLVESGKIDLEAEIQKYLPDYPRQSWENEPVKMTVQHLATNSSGIRHYDTKDNVWSTLVRPVAVQQQKQNKDTVPAKQEKSTQTSDPEPFSEKNKNSVPSSKNGQAKPNASSTDQKLEAAKPDPKTGDSKQTPDVSKAHTELSDAKTDSKPTKNDDISPKKQSEPAVPDKKNSGQKTASHTRRNYPNAKESLALFADDPLVVKPGSKFAYSTHGYAVLSAIVESVSGTDMAFQMGEFCCRKLGMFQTFIDRRQPVIRNRATHYCRDANHVINNVVVGESHWPGAVLSCAAGDLLIFGNFMLESYANAGSDRNGELLKQETVKKLWSPAIDAGSRNLAKFYGMGWRVEPGDIGDKCKFVYHTGAGAGSSSVLFIIDVQAAIRKFFLAVPANFGSPWKKSLRPTVASSLPYFSQFSSGSVPLHKTPYIRTLSYYQKNVRKEQDKNEIINRIRMRFIEALETRNSGQLAEAFKKAHTNRGCGFLCKKDSDLRLVEANLLETIPESVLCRDSALFAAVAALLEFTRAISPKLVKQFLSLQDHFPKFFPADIDTPVSLMSLFNKASIQIGGHTRKNVDQWMASYLRSAAEKKVTKRFCQLISCCGNASLTLGHSTSVQLIDHMLDLVNSIRHPSTENNVALATYLWYWKNAAHPVSHYSSRFYSAWEEVAIESVHLFNGRDCAMVLNSLADQKLKPGEEFLHKICMRMNMSSIEYEQQVVANCLRSLAWVMKHHNFDQIHILKETNILSSLIQPFHDYLKAHQLDSQTLSNMVWAIGEFHPFFPFFTERNFSKDVFDHSEAILPACDQQNLANIFLALSKITVWNMIPTSWLKVFWKRYSVVLKKSTDQELANTYSALGLFDPSPIEFKYFPLEQMFEEVRARVPNAGPLHLSQWVLHSGKLGILDNVTIEKSVARIIDLCKDISSMRHCHLACNFATGLSLLGFEIPSELVQFLLSSIGLMDTRDMLAFLDALIIQSCVFGMPVSNDWFLQLTSQIDLKDLTDVSDISVCQTALTWFGADYFPRNFVDFINANQKKLKDRLQMQWHQGMMKQPTNTHEADVVEILSLHFPHLKLHRNKVIPEAACVVNVEVLDEELQRRWALQIDGPAKYYFLPNGKCTYKETAKTRRNTRILEKVGYGVPRVRFGQSKDTPGLIALFERYFGK